MDWETLDKKTSKIEKEEFSRWGSRQENGKRNGQTGPSITHHATRAEGSDDVTPINPSIRNLENDPPVRDNPNFRAITQIISRVRKSREKHGVGSCTADAM